jgi:hypothetical protein
MAHPTPARLPPNDPELYLYDTSIGLRNIFDRGDAVAMAIGILAAVLGLLLSTAAIVIPRMVNRHNNPADDAVSRAYLASTGRSAQEVAEANRDGLARPAGDTEPRQARADPAKAS